MLTLPHWLVEVTHAQSQPSVDAPGWGSEGRMSLSQSDPAKQGAGGDNAKEASAPTGGGEWLGGALPPSRSRGLGKGGWALVERGPPHPGSGRSGTQTKEAVTGELC